MYLNTLRRTTKCEGMWMCLPLLLLSLCPVCPKLSEQHCWSYQTCSKRCWPASSSVTLRRHFINKISDLLLDALQVQIISMRRANLCVASRPCVPSLPTGGWCQSCWQAPSLLFGWLRFQSYMFPQACVVSLSWPLTSRPLLWILVLCHLKHTFVLNSQLTQ